MIVARGGFGGLWERAIHFRTFLAGFWTKLRKKIGKLANCPPQVTALYSIMKQNHSIIFIFHVNDRLDFNDIVH